MLGAVIGFDRSQVVQRPLDCYRSTTYLLLRSGLHMRMFYLQPDEVIRGGGGSSVEKGGESDVKNQDLYSGSPRLYCLRTDGLVPVSKY
jgi:hypothetical protein